MLPRLKSVHWIATLGFAAIVVGFLFSPSAFRLPPLNILDFAVRKRGTEDFVPRFPWIGVVLMGVASGLLWRVHDFRPVPALKPLACSGTASKGSGRYGTLEPDG